MALSDEEWWGLFGQMDVDGESTTPHEVQALREYLEGQTVPPEAAKRIMTLREDQVPADGNWDKGSRISWFIYDACMHFPEKIPAILDLVDAIRAMPELEMTEEQKVRLEGVWKDWKYLTELDTIFKDGYERRWETRYPTDHDGGPGSSDWVSASTLMANYCIRYTDCFYELHHRGFRTIITTLEQDPWNHASPRWDEEGRKTKTTRLPQTHEYSITMLNTNVLGLVPWFKIAGRLIYNYVDDEPLSIMSDNKRFAYLKYPDSNLWHGKPRFSRERWAFWKERLGWITEQDSLLQNTRDTASMLVNCMDEIEKDPQSEIWKRSGRP